MNTPISLDIRTACDRFGKRREPRGAIMIVALLSLILLAAIVFYIFNVGNHVSKRVETQNAADNAAISGARWTARSFNTVAANNVEISRLIPLAGILDAVPLAVSHTLEDQTAVLTALDRQNRVGYADDYWVNRAIAETVAPNISRQIDYLTPINALLNGGDYDIARTTFYQSTSGQRGEIWEAIEALADVNRTTMENLAVLTQQSGFRGAQISQREGGRGAGGLLLPWELDVPWDEGAFDDFETVVQEGQLPEGQNDPQFNRGPFDVLFGLRESGRVSNVIFSNLPQDVRHSTDALGWIAPPNTRQFERADIESYNTIGTYEQMVGQIMELASSEPVDRDGRRRPGTGGFFAAPSPPMVVDENAPLAPSQWGRRIEFGAGVKMNACFPGTATPGRVVHDPEWITDYDAAEAIDNSAPETIVYGLYLAMEFRRFKTSTGFTFTEPELMRWGLRRDLPLAPDTRGRLGVLEIADQVWREELPQSDDPDFAEGEPQYLNYLVWLGINVGEEVSIRNPYNFDQEQRNAMPGPVNFTVDEFSPEDSATLDALKIFGIAHQPKDARFWPEKFDEGRPDSKMVAVAQAQVFNNHSWDLWTAMWHAQLTPIDDLDDWMEALEDPQALDQTPWIEEDDLNAVTAYLRATKPLMDLMLEGE
ncbi:MAG: pilus assembly protein TadG-related protein [Planctomycetota bacterium]